MKSFIEQAQFYAAYHEKLATRYSHLIGVPLVIFSLMIFLGFIQIIVPRVFATNLAAMATLAALIYYFILNWRLALALTPIMISLLWIANWISYDGPTEFGLWAFGITFVIGWAFQFYGHFVEGKKPAFMDNFGQALIAPLYLTAEVFFMAGYMHSLKDQIYGSEPNSTTL